MSKRRPDSGEDAGASQKKRRMESPSMRRASKRKLVQEHPHENHSAKRKNVASGSSDDDNSRARRRFSRRIFDGRSRGDETPGPVPERPSNYIETDQPLGGVEGRDDFLCGGRQQALPIVRNAGETE